MERTPPGDDKKPGEEPKDKELPLPQVAEGQVPAEQGGYRGYGTSPTQSESDLFAEFATFGTSLPQKHHENQYKSVHWANSTP